MHPTTPNQMLAVALANTHGAAARARAELDRLYAHLDHLRDHGDATDTISLELTASVANKQTARNAYAGMCHQLRASHEQIAVALGADKDAFYTLWDCLNSN